MFRSYETIFDNVPEGEEGEAKKETKGSSKVRHQSNKVIADHLELDWMKKYHLLIQYFKLPHILYCESDVTSLFTITARDP